MALIEGKNARWCLHCDTLKHFNKFYNQKDGKYGKHSRCKKCKGIIDKQFYKDNSIKNKVYVRNVIRNSFERNLEKFKCWVLKEKACSTCKEIKSFSSFRVKKGRKFGLKHLCIKCDNKYHRERRRTNLKVKIKGNYISRLNLALKNNIKSNKTEKLLDCSIEELKRHLESQFKIGMSWDNREEWHIDHEIPCSLFDLTDPHQQAVCFHWSNLQPLWAEDNLSKKDSIIGFEDLTINKEFLNRYINNGFLSTNV